MRSPVIQVALMRLRETFRQPEIIFWAFVFPTLLAPAPAGARRAARRRPTAWPRR